MDNRVSKMGIKQYIVLTLITILLILGVTYYISCEYSDAGAPNDNLWIGNFANPYYGIVSNNIYTLSDNGTWFRVTDNVTGGGGISEEQAQEMIDESIDEHSGIPAAHHARYTDNEARDAAVSDAAYGVGWDGVTNVAPSKNAVYDKIETIGGGDIIKTIMVDQMGYSSLSSLGNWRGGKITTTATDIWWAFIVPDDFVELVSAKVYRICVIAGTTHRAKYYINSGKEGDYYTHGAAEYSPEAVPESLYTMYLHDITVLFAGVTAGDNVAILVEANTTANDMFFPIMFSYK